MLAFVRGGDISAAKGVVEWARVHASRTAAWRCAVFFAQEQLAAVMRAHPSVGQLSSGVLNAHEQEIVADVLQHLAPIVAAVDKQVENELESQALEAAMFANGWLARRTKSEDLARILATRTPVPMALAQAALAGHIAASPELPERLREEHPTSFQAKCLAALVEGKVLGCHRAAFQAAKALISEASSDSDREQLVRVLIDLAQGVGDEANRDVDRLTESLSRDQRLRKLLAADRLLKKGAYAEADPILAETRDETDPTWLQLAANQHLQAGEVTRAIDLLLKATALLPDPKLIGATARIACEHNKQEAAAEALGRLLKVRPDDIPAHRSLAELYAQMGDYARAANQYRELVGAIAQRSEDHDPSRGQADRINQAICLARSNQLEESLEVFRSLCKQPDPPLRALLGLAEVLTALGRAEEAFNTLRQVQDKYWGESEFVQEFLQAAYRSGNDDAGHQAMVQL
ncbi:MAG: tetratricopeptide repeat protein, partial [Fimbriimonadales bacterium]